jgi:hypothetical protein
MVRHRFGGASTSQPRPARDGGGHRWPADRRAAPAAELSPPVAIRVAAQPLAVMISVSVAAVGALRRLFQAMRERARTWRR